MDLFKKYKQYVQDYGDIEGIVEKRWEKWKEYENKGIIVDYANYPPENDWLDEVFKSGSYRWRDHERIVFIDGEPALIISEPYSLPKECISELIDAGDELGFMVSINRRFANHVGDTDYCIELAPFRWRNAQRRLETRLGS